jgi:hypothetical protein
MHKHVLSFVSVFLFAKVVKSEDTEEEDLCGYSSGDEVDDNLVNTIWTRYWQYESLDV